MHRLSNEMLDAQNVHPEQFIEAFNATELKCEDSKQDDFKEKINHFLQYPPLELTMQSDLMPSTSGDVKVVIV